MEEVAISLNGLAWVEMPLQNTYVLVVEGRNDTISTDLGLENNLGNDAGSLGDDTATEAWPSNRCHRTLNIVRSRSSSEVLSHHNVRSCQSLNREALRRFRGSNNIELGGRRG